MNIPLNFQFSNAQLYIHFHIHLVQRYRHVKNQQCGHFLQHLKETRNFPNEHYNYHHNNYSHKLG
jgi:hypothetical protein